MFKALTRVRQQWLAYRIRQVRKCILREHALHQMQMAQLRAELDALELRLAPTPLNPPLSAVRRAM
ncbi:hypothetical protein [Ottowia sp. VDI28]|uniref:hypothetical protein n=1 Tax=Ottowia sp. VDI28 TaxID=3133968 RepID=UPI003C2C5851